MRAKNIVGQSLEWKPPTSITRDEIVNASQSVLGKADIPIIKTEEVFRIESLGLEWDIGLMVYAPTNVALIPKSPDGRKVGFFLLHGGESDHRYMEPLARILAGKYGFKVTSMTYPGRLYLPDPTRNWPGDTIGPDGTVRTPIWRDGEFVTRDQIEIILDTSMRARYGTRTNARARPGTPFYERMAAWPVAFEDAMKDICARHLPPDSFAIHVHGHSTGGPFVHMLTQRVSNIVGVVGIENSPFSYIYQKIIGIEWRGPFNDLYIRTWRDIARYRGAEALHQEGVEVLMRLPWLMEDVFENWEKSKASPNFKAEYIVHYACIPALEESARVAARRRKLNEADTAALIDRYVGYTRELSGPGVKSVPPILLGITKYSRDHRPEIYRNVVLPAFASMKPAPNVNLVQFEAGNHHYERPEPDLPMGLVPAVTKLWDEAIQAGYYSPSPG